MYSDRRTQQLGVADMTNQERIEDIELYAVMYRSAQRIKEIKAVTPELEDWMTKEDDTNGTNGEFGTIAID